MCILKVRKPTLYRFVPALIRFSRKDKTYTRHNRPSLIPMYLLRVFVVARPNCKPHALPQTARLLRQHAKTRCVRAEGGSITAKSFANLSRHVASPSFEVPCGRYGHVFMTAPAYWGFNPSCIVFYVMLWLLYSMSSLLILKQASRWKPINIHHLEFTELNIAILPKQSGPEGCKMFGWAQGCHAFMY